MKTYKVTVMQLTRIEVEVLAENEAKAKEGWQNGKLLRSTVAETDILDVQRGI